MRRVDADASNIGGIPGIVLMENAAIACFEELKKDLGIVKDKLVLVFCGKGNNGGDGFAIARHLKIAGARVIVYPIAGTELSGDALVNYDIADKMGIVKDFTGIDEHIENELRCADAVVDAIYGTGIRGTVREDGYEVIEAINANAKYVLSVDIPSGINADTGEVCGICVRADKTVTFAAWKIGMLMYPGADYVGSVVLAPISVPEYILDMDKELVEIIDESWSVKHRLSRKNDSQKADYGKIFIIAGSEGMSGAAYMSAQAALYGGAGLVTVGVCESIAHAMEVKTTEAMTLVLDDNDGHIALGAEPAIMSQMAKSDVILIGPGLGRSREVGRIIRNVLAAARVPVVVDADALYAVAKDMTMLSDCGCPLIFTPHEAEMARLINSDIEYVRSHRLEVSREFCERYGVTLILKGSRTIVTTPELKQYINITGNPGMATGGSGDVLAGLVAAFSARAEKEGDAAVIAVRHHGLAGDYAMEKYGMEAMTAVDVLNSLKRI